MAAPKHARTKRPDEPSTPSTRRELRAERPSGGDGDRAKASRSLRPREAFRAHLRAIGPDRPKLYLAALLATVVGALEAAMLLLLARVTMAVATGEDEVSLQIGTLGGATYTVGQTVGILVGVLVAIMIAVGPLSWVQAQLSFRVARRLRSDLVDAYLHSDWAYRKSLREGYLVQLMGDSAQRAEIAIGSVVAGMSGLIVVLVPIVLLAVAQPAMFAMSAVGLLLIAAILRPVSSRHKQAAVENARVLGTMASSVSEAARLDSEIAAFHVEARVASHLDTEIDASSRALRSLRFVGRLVPALFQYLALTAVVGLMAALLASDSATIEEIAPLVLILVRSLTYIRHVITALQSAIELTPFVTSIHDATEDLRAHRRPDGGRTPDGFDRISLHGVGFSFSPDHPVLADVDLELRVGEIVGVVGASGAGKSTLSHLVLGLREPTAGAVLVDDVDLREVDRAWWAEQVGYVPQDNQLIYGTVLDNIAFLRPDVDRATCIAAARLAHLDREIEELPDGWDTVLGRGARDLSGGQCQRLGIARALAGRPRMLVLDEPTSALDMRSEQLIRTTLDEIRALTAVLIIAHRPATLEICDRVVRVADGAVAEVSVEVGVVVGDEVGDEVSEPRDTEPG